MRYIKTADEREISAVALGCMRIADMTMHEVDTFVHTALDAGINFVDEADIYGKGKSEEILGRLLTQQRNLRDRLFIQSKCAIHDGMFDFSKEYILQAVDGILSRLRTDHLDSLLLHRPDALMEPSEVAEAFDQLQKSGKVLSFGVSNQGPMLMYGKEASNRKQ